MNQAPSIFVAAQQIRYTLQNDKPYSGSFQPWTAGRCQRLLRPIISRVELLKRDPSRYTTVGCQDLTEIQATLKPVPIKASVAAFGACKEDGKCWSRGRKRVRTTYSARTKLQDAPHTHYIPGNLKIPKEKSTGHRVRLQPGEFSVPTPILIRTRTCSSDIGCELPIDLLTGQSPQHKITKGPRSRYAANGGSIDFEVAEIMRRINRKTNTARFKVYEGIYNSLDALFKATVRMDEQPLLSAYDTSRRQPETLSSASRVPHSRSLFSVCLRGVPNSIRDAEHRLASGVGAMGQNLAIDTHIISTETYAELESLGTSQVGWKHLRSVVRAHGVLVISDAIRDGLLDADIASALVMLCVHMSFQNEAEQLLTSLLKSSVYPEPESTQSHFRDNPSLLPLLMLEKFVRCTGRVCYYHRQVLSVISNGSLSIKWLCTKQFNSLWTSLFRSLSTNPLDRDATKFMTIMLPLFCKAQSSAYSKHELSVSTHNSMLSVLETTLASVLTTLLAMSMLSVGQSNISQILKSAFIDCQILSIELHNHGSALLTMANLLASIGVDDTAFARQLVSLLTHKFSQSSYSLRINDCIPQFICSVARCCGRGSSGDGFEHLKNILKRLITFVSLDSSKNRDVVEQVVVESAFAFADEFPLPKHIQYAQHLRANMRRFLTQSKSSRAKKEASYEVGFRWEEGIDEWVVSTPIGRLKESQEKELLASDEDSDCDSPIRLNQKRPRLQNAFHIRGGVHSYRCNRISDLAPDSPKVNIERVDPMMQHDRLIQGEDSRSLPNKSPKLNCPKFGRRPFTKLPTLGCELLHSCPKNWMLSINNDDELNQSHAPKTDATQDVFQELSNATEHGKKIAQMTKFLFYDSLEERGRSLMEQSEDELGL